MNKQQLQTMTSIAAIVLLLVVPLGIVLSAILSVGMSPAQVATMARGGGQIVWYSFIGAVIVIAAGNTLSTLLPDRDIYRR